MKKSLLITAACIASLALVAIPVRLVWNSATAATIRTTLVSKTLATKTTIAQNPKGYIGTGWVRNLTGSGSTALNKANCDLQGVANWVWFEDANGDGTTNDAEDGECVKVVAVTPSGTSWNGALRMSSSTLAATNASGGASNTVTTATVLTAGKYIGSIVKIISGTAANSWGIVKTNDASSVTIYGAWHASDYTFSGAVPDGTSVFQIFDDNKYDNSWIGDYTCTGNFPSGTVVNGSYPSSGEASAIATTDCYDGKRDFLPNETDRGVLSGTATATSSTSITDSAQNMTVNSWMGQKVLITGGTGKGSYGVIESNTATVITVSSWIGAAPDVGSIFKIIYIIPRSSYVTGATMSQIINGTASDDAKANKGPLTTEALKNWKGTRLPTSMDFFGFCGAKAGDSYNTAGDSTYKSSGASSNTSIGNYGSNVGRGKNSAPNDKYMYLSNSGSWEWLSEPHYIINARLAGGYACSNISLNYVYSGYRFRAVFRP